MFIPGTTIGGYDRSGQQFCRGLYLGLFSRERYRIMRRMVHIRYIVTNPQPGGWAVKDTSNDSILGIWGSPEEADASAPWEGCVYEVINGEGAAAFDGGSRDSEACHKWIKENGGYHDLFAAVRHVSLQQLGHFMMGTFRIGEMSITVSGPYGSDGLPLEYFALTERARQLLTPVPEDLARLYWSGGGHNDVGSEAPAMRQWAKENLEQLAPKLKRGQVRTARRAR